MCCGLRWVCWASGCRNVCNATFRYPFPYPLYRTDLIRHLARGNTFFTLENLRNIIDACVKDQAASQKALYERFYGYALKIVFRYIYRYDRAADVVNDGFVKVFRNMHRFTCDDQMNVEQRFMGWMKKIMINSAIDELRRNNMIAEIGGIPDHAWEVPDNGPMPDQSVLYKELITVIKQLPPSYRTVFNMVVLDGLTHHEVASVLGISVGTSKSNLSRARTLLQKHIKDREAPEACNM